MRIKMSLNKAASKDSLAMQEAFSKCLPGFRFSPTEQELVAFYLKMASEGKDIGMDLITTIDLYKFDPWELPGLARMGEREWYFFVPRDLKYPNGCRPNRVAKSGYWKATGTDRPVMTSDDDTGNINSCIGLKKTLVFYAGKAPRGTKTPWIMNEFRLQDTEKLKNDLTLCRIYQKGTVRALGRYFEVDETTPSSSQSPPLESIGNVEKREEEYIPNLTIGGRIHEDDGKNKQISSEDHPTAMMLSPDNNFVFYGYQDVPENCQASSSSSNLQADGSKYAHPARLGLDDDFDFYSTVV